MSERATVDAQIDDATRRMHREAERTGAGDADGSRRARLNRQRRAVAALVDLLYDTSRPGVFSGARQMFMALTGLTLDQTRQLMSAEISARQVKAKGAPITSGP